MAFNWPNTTPPPPLGLTSTPSLPCLRSASCSDRPTQPYSRGVKTVVGTWGNRPPHVRVAAAGGTLPEKPQLNNQPQTPPAGRSSTLEKWTNTANNNSPGGVRSTQRAGYVRLLSGFLNLFIYSGLQSDSELRIVRRDHDRTMWFQSLTGFMFDKQSSGKRDQNILISGLGFIST